MVIRILLSFDHFGQSGEALGGFSKAGAKRHQGDGEPHNALAVALGRAIQDSFDFVLVAPVSLSVVCFRYQPKNSNMDDKSSDTLNQELADQVCDEGNFFLTTTTVRSRTTLRACFLHYGNAEHDVKDLLTTLQRAASRLGTDGNRAKR